ncbi:MAG: hypothetical protein ACXV4C_07330 [Halobacteriota archaeon]
MPNKPRSDQKSKRKTVEAVVVTDSLHFETEYLILRLTDAFRLVQKREQLIRSVLECLKSVVKDHAQMGILRKESALFGIQVDADKERASAELQQQLAELKEQQEMLRAVISAVKAAAKLPRTFTPSDFEKVPPDAKEIVFASLKGKAIRFDGMSGYLQEHIETSDPRVVAALARHHMGRPVIVG